MARRPREAGESGIYHVMSRGAGKQIIFEDIADHERYLNYLYKYVSESEVELLAWCLMDNHVHLLMRANIQDLSLLMHQLNTAYAVSFNKRYDRVGPLFQGRFKSENVDNDEYLMTVLRYIHQNPIKAGLCKDCSYRWSSYNAYLESAVPARNIRSWVMDLFGDVETFIRFHGQIDAQRLGIDGGPDKRQITTSMIATANTAISPFSVSELRGLKKQERDATLVALVRSGLSLRQIERITGIAKSVVSDVDRRYRKKIGH